MKKNQPMLSGKLNKTYQQLASFVVRRYRANAKKTMLDIYQIDPNFLGLDSDFMEFAATDREGIVAVLEDPVLAAELLELFVKASVEFTYQNNQFIQLDRQEMQIFRGLYVRYLEAMKVVLKTAATPHAIEAGLARVVREHFEDLRSNISRFFDFKVGTFVQENVILKQVVCSEYSPDLQLRLLGLEHQTILDPVLDVGCGKSGKLVRYLNDLGFQAVGADRLVDADPHLMEADWFSLPLTRNNWGTILSHMAFSNHFLFHHYYSQGSPEKYARQYMKLLAALKPGGRFCYCPGLPFIEDLLPPEMYTVERQQLDAPELAQARPPNFLYAQAWYTTQILKR
jgi:hypothetical protein